MKASVDGYIVAQSDDIVAFAGYQYFPRPAVRMDWLEKAEKTANDLNVPTASSSTTSSWTAGGTRARRGPTKRRGRRWRKSPAGSASGRTSR